jgi:hypothetical protein
MAVKRASAFFALLLCAEASTSAPLEVKVVGDRVNLRARPLFDAEVAGQVSSGVVLGAPDGIPEGAEWVKVRPPQSVDLWIFSSLVKDGVVTADDTYVRCGPGQQYKPVGKVGKGFKVETRGTASGDWLRIAPVPTVELFISSNYVLAVPPAAAESEGTGNGEQGTEVKISEGKSQISSPIPEPPQHAPTNQLPNSPTNQLPNSPTNQLTNSPANQLANQPTIQRINEQTNKRINEQTNNRINELPAILSGHTLAPIPRQGEVITLHGRLERLSLGKMLSFSKYRLVDKTGYPRSTVICHIIGLQGQWHELDGSEVEIEGRLWTLRDSISEVLPVIDASRVRRIASWEK